MNEDGVQPGPSHAANDTNRSEAHANRIPQAVPGLRHRLRLASGLSWHDYKHEWVLSGCAVLALSAVLIPLLVLFGLKYGIIQNLLGPLVDNPQYREITSVSSGNFEPAWFASMRKRADVAFVVPKTRSLAAIINLRAADAEGGRIITAELVPSGSGDPALQDIQPPQGLNEIVLSSSAAIKLGLGAGDKVEGILSRTLHGQRDAVRHTMTVLSVAPDNALSRDGLFVSVDLMAAVEDFLDGRAVPALGWAGDAPRPAARPYAAFRLYARSLDDVATLRRDLLQQGIDVRTRAADIALVQTLNRNLDIVYWIIAVLAIGGYCVSFGTQVWATVDRKRQDFSFLRLTGFRTVEIVCFPILQAGFTAVLAWALGSLVFLITQTALNTLFAASAAAAGGVVCRLQPWHLLAALGMTLLAAIIPAILGGRRVAGLEPSIGLRDS